MKKLSFLVAAIATVGAYNVARLLGVSQAGAMIAIGFVAAVLTVFTFSAAAFSVAASALFAYAALNAAPVAAVVAVVAAFIILLAVDGKSEPEKSLLVIRIVCESATIVGALLVTGPALTIGITLGGCAVLAVVGRH